MRKAAQSAAVSGICAALALVLMFLGTLIPIGTYCSPMLASVLLIPVKDVSGNRIGFGWYFAVSLLSLLILPDREAAILFVLLGYYPLVKEWFDKCPYRLARAAGKLLLFSAAFFALAVLLQLLGLPTLTAEYQGSPFLAAFIIGFFLISAVTFLFYDKLLSSLVSIWKIKRDRFLHF